jgi:predicted nucleic acid-binding Zn ribbon protein
VPDDGSAGLCDLVAGLMTTWRSLPTPRPEREPQPVAGSLENVAARLGVPSPQVLARVFSGWERLVGANVAAHATPVSLRDGVLVVMVDQPAWATQLRFLTADVRRRLNEAAGDEAVGDVQIRVTPEAGGGRRRRGGKPPV